jgi:predicted SnoaL-like aldol condensation-catalyzing enzyme
VTSMALPFVTPEPGPASAARTSATREVVAAFVRTLYVDRDVERAFTTFVHTDYIQHNPGIPDGREAAMTALAPMFADPDFHADLRRVIVDGDYAVIQLRGYRTGQRGGAVVDMYRVQDGLVVEHWDVIQQIPETAANDHPLL